MSFENIESQNRLGTEPHHHRFDNFSPEAESAPEKIECAFVKFGDEYFTAQNHLSAILEIQKKYPDYQSQGKQMTDGFQTTLGRFVTRDEAYKIAGKAGQLKDDDEHRSHLQSEDLH